MRVLREGTEPSDAITGLPTVVTRYLAGPRTQGMRRSGIHPVVNARPVRESFEIPLADEGMEASIILAPSRSGVSRRSREQPGRLPNEGTSVLPGAATLRHLQSDPNGSSSSL